MSGSIYQSPNTATLSLAGNAQAVNNIATGTYPPEGSRAVTVQYNWNTQTAYSEDLQSLVARGVESTIQGAFIDNTSNAAEVIFYIPGTMQSIMVPPYSYVIAPALFGSALNFQISIPSFPTITGSGFPPIPSNLTRVHLLNVPVTYSLSTPNVYPVDGGQLVIFCNASQVIKNGRGRVAVVSVTTAIATGTVQLFDASASFVLLTIPTGAPVGTIYTLNMPFFFNLNIVYNGGATGNVSVSFS